MSRAHPHNMRNERRLMWTRRPTLACPKPKQFTLLRLLRLHLKEQDIKDNQPRIKFGTKKK